MMNIQEFATAAEEGLDVKVILLNNGHLGLVRQQQTLFYDDNLSAVKYQQRTNFTMAAESMGVKGVDLATSENPLEDLRAALLETGPCLINIPIAASEMVYPMVAPGGANADMIGGEA